MNALNITVMLGGPSAERTVSLESGAAMAKALRSLGHRVTELDPAGDTWQLPAGTQVVCLALHGTYGEDGTVQTRLESLGIPYTGCDPAASRTAFNKALAKDRFRAAGVPTPESLLLDRDTDGWPPGWEPPVVVKPVCQGSSVGLCFVDRPEDWTPALQAALHCDHQALVERRVTGRETTVGILDHRPLPIVEIRPHNGRYDWSSKYTAGATDYRCPAEFDPETTARIQAAGLAAFSAVGGRDYGRVDILVDNAGVPWVLEVNTLPGMTRTSLLPQAAAAAGLDFPALCQRMVELALARHHPTPHPPPFG